MKVPVNRTGMIAAIIAAVVAAALAAWALTGRDGPATRPEPDGAVVATNGIHWHARLEIYVDGAKQVVSPNIGIGPRYAELPTYDRGMQMTAIHTHDADGTIHLEFPGRVTEDDLRLGNVFKIWVKKFDAFGSKLIMTVNGTESGAGERYVMRDGDKIILSYFR